ncbi:MAG: hypothetical protein IPM54_30525 [Polyangiaceae bacterium]|nr:hypothetical protein [Polyangiaceae bacterium]
MESPRADFLIQRQEGKSRRGATALRRLWGRLGKVTVLEYKSPVKSSFRCGDLVRLVGYGALYHARHAKLVCHCDELTLVLVVASVTPTLVREIEQMGWTLETMEIGYARIHGTMYPCFVVIIDDVCQVERSELLRVFSHHPVTDARADAWISYWMKEPKMKGPPGFSRAEADEFMRQVMGRLPVKTRLAGIAPEELVVNLPLDALRALSNEYIQSLAPDVRRKVQQRLRTGSAKAKAAKTQGPSSTKKTATPASRRPRKAA